MGNVRVTLAVGIALIAAGGAVVLTRSPPRVVRVGEPDARAGLADITGDLAVCQANEVLPAGVTGIRLSMWAFVGWKMRVEAYYGPRLLTQGTRGADWTSDSVTVPVKPLAHATSGVTLCFAIGPNSEPAVILGSPAPAPQAAVVMGGDTPTPQAPQQARLPGRVGVEYLAAGRGSWWSRALSVARHMGLGRAFSGTWIALLVAALMASVAVLAVGLALRELP